MIQHSKRKKDRLKQTVFYFPEQRIISKYPFKALNLQGFNKIIPTGRGIPAFFMILQTLF
jgi:hypothetical protein